MRMANMHVVGGETMVDHALRKLPFQFGSDERVVAAFAAGRAGADVEQIVRVGVGDLDGPVAVRMSGAVRMIGPSGEFEKRAAVDRVVIRRVRHDVVGGRERLHVADLIDWRGRRDLLGLFQGDGVQPDFSLALHDRERQGEDVVLNADGIIPLLFGLRVLLANLLGRAGLRGRRLRDLPAGIKAVTPPSRPRSCVSSSSLLVTFIVRRTIGRRSRLSHGRFFRHLPASDRIQASANRDAAPA